MLLQLLLVHMLLLQMRLLQLPLRLLLRGLQVLQLTVPLQLLPLPMQGLPLPLLDPSAVLQHLLLLQLQQPLLLLKRALALIGHGSAAHLQGPWLLALHAQRRLRGQTTPRCRGCTGDQNGDGKKVPAVNINAPRRRGCGSKGMCIVR